MNKMKNNGNVISRCVEAPVTCPSLRFSMNCPPTKRLRGLNQDVVTAAPFDDPFGDEEEFTQDDLDEIDIIASQAITSGAAGMTSVPGSRPATEGQSKPLIRAAANQSRGNAFAHTRGTAGKLSREPHGEFALEEFISPLQSSSSLKY